MKHQPEGHDGTLPGCEACWHEQDAKLSAALLRIADMRIGLDAEYKARRDAQLKYLDEEAKLQESNRLLGEVVKLVPHTTGAHIEGFPCDGCVALKRFGIDRGNPFEKAEHIDCTCGTTSHVHDGTCALFAEKRIAPVKIDTCGNVRRDGSDEVVSHFCTTFESSGYPAHSPTCQFFQK